MCLHIDSSSLDLYADDSTLYKSGIGITEIQHNLQNSLEIMLTWCTVNNMLVNPNKTKCKLIGPKHKLNSINLELKINDGCIELVKSHKILGVHVDKHLSWNIYIDKTCTAINNKINLFKRISTFLTMEMKQLFYNSYILPFFDYCCTVWWKSAKYRTSKLSVLQKRAARITLGAPSRTSSIELFAELNWLTFDNRCDYHAGVLIFKCRNNLSPRYIGDIISFSSKTKYNLRSSAHYDIINSRFNTLFKKKAFSFYSMNIWNKIPISIRVATSLSNFKHQLKQYLFSKQSITSANNTNKLP